MMCNARGGGECDTGRHFSFIKLNNSFTVIRATRWNSWRKNCMGLQKKKTVVRGNGLTSLWRGFHRDYFFGRKPWIIHGYWDICFGKTHNAFKCNLSFLWAPQSQFHPPPLNGGEVNLREGDRKTWANKPLPLVVWHSCVLWPLRVNNYNNYGAGGGG